MNGHKQQTNGPTVCCCTVLPTKQRSRNKNGSIFFLVYIRLNCEPATTTTAAAATTTTTTTTADHHWGDQHDHCSSSLGTTHLQQVSLYKH